MQISFRNCFYTCFTSDLFLEDADIRREDGWRMIKERSDCEFFIMTKRIHRFTECIPEDWGEGYEKVTIAVTTGNQRMADYRLPIYLSLPIRRKQIICEPLLEDIFSFHQTGANFIKYGRKYFIPKSKQREQARKAGIDYCIDLPQ
ncbi:MAG: DUF5131 family protein [Clostridia bacterium]|nr:DUF5131 family protein [Clostridia bacterium]